MKLVCPGCGLTASAETWADDAACREAVAAIVALPSPLPPVVLPYLSLFRPASRALSWAKVLRLTKELTKLVATGHAQVQGKVARSCPARIWAQAMEEMIARRDRLSRPLPNHNYLRQVAWGLADEADAANERKRNEAERTGNARAAGTAQDETPMDREAVRRGLDEFKQKMGW